MPDKPKYSVLTYIYNNYEIVHEVKEKDPDAEYILVTDDPNLKSNTWTVVYDPIGDMSPWSKMYTIRFKPFNYVNSDIVVRIDGSIEIRKSLRPLVDTFIAGNYDRCMMLHPDRNTFEPELDCWVTYRGYNSKCRDRCLDMMRKMGYDLHYKGLFQGCFEIVRNNTVNRDINNLTLGLMYYTGGDTIDRVDQHITSFVINHFFSDKIKILPVSESIITNGKLMQWYVHHSNKPIIKPQTIPQMMFNIPCVPWDYIYNK